MYVYIYVDLTTCENIDKQFQLDILIGITWTIFRSLTYMASFG